MKTKRQLGKSLEYYVAERLQEVLGDPTIKPTKASGASTQLADILCSKYIIECKARSTKSITINENTWNKLLGEIPIGSIRTPLYVLENVNKKRWVCLDLEDFLKLVKEK